MKLPRELRISFKLDPNEHMELWLFAANRHVGGQFPVNAFAKEAAFAYMAKYPIPEARRALLVARYHEAYPDAKAAQPGDVEKELSAPSGAGNEGEA